jgi:hypothetical protein
VSAVHPRASLWRRHFLRPVVGLLVLNLVALVTFTLPRRWQEQNASLVVESLRQQVAEQRAITEALDARIATAQTNARELSRFYDEVVCAGPSAFLELVEELEEIVSELGLPPERRGYTPEPVTGAPLERVMITLPETGSYEQLGQLLDRLERTRHFVVIEEVGLDGSSSGSRLDVAVSTYCRIDGGVS